MINCQITQYGKVREEIVHENGMIFSDNHGMERSNYIDTRLVEASLQEWHYDRFGIMNQHFRGREEHAGFCVNHEVRPAMMFSIGMQGRGVKNVYAGRGVNRNVDWKKGDANIFLLNGRGGVNLNLDAHVSLDILNIVIPQQFIESLIEHDEQAFEPLARFAHHDFAHQFLFRENRPVEEAVMKAARDINRCRMLGNNAHKYLEAKIVDCLSGFLLPSGESPSSTYFSHAVRDKIHDAHAIILERYMDMPSLHELAAMVGTNECTLKKAFKQEFGTTVFQCLFDYRMDMAARYLLDTDLPVSEIGFLLGYDYQSHFCTAFKRKYGMAPMEYRSKRGDGREERIAETYV